MKRLFNLILIFTLVFSIRMNVNALSSSLSVSSGTIENGSSVKATVTLSDVAAWNIKIFSSGATSGCDAAYADATGNGKNATKTFTVTCKSTSTGVINISVSGDITSEDGSNKNVSVSKTVKVTNAREKSTNNYLSSLSVEGYEISPAFDKNTLEYSVDVPNTVEKIVINAKKADSYASVSGTGEVEVLEGANKFLIVVTSETGKDRTYTLNVNVEDKDPIVVNVNGVDYTLVKNKKALTLPDLFTETTVEINGYQIPAFYSEITKITLVGLKDSEGNIKLFIYNDGKYEEYRELKVANTILNLRGIKELKYYTKDTITINDIEYDCLKVSQKSDFGLFYGTNMATGEKGYYLYDIKEQTLQRYDDELILVLEDELQKEKDNTKMLYLVIIGLSVFVVVIIIIFSIKNRKIKKTLNLGKKENKKNTKNMLE